MAAEVWKEAAEALAAKIVEHVTSVNALALTVRNISSLEDDSFFQVRRALRAQLRGQKVRLTESKQANADVRVTLSENTEGYLWIAEIREHTSPNSTAEDAASPVLMVSVARTRLDEGQPASEPLSIRKTRVYQQTGPMLDLAILENPAAGPGGSRVPADGATHVLVLSPASVSLYERAEASDTVGKTERQWRLKQSAPITRLRPWPRDARGRIILRTDSMFDAYLPGTKCSGSLEPVLTLECHESDEPWPLIGGKQEANSAMSGAGDGPAAYFTADRNYFDGRIRLDDVHEMKAPPFLAAVVMPPNGTRHAGLLEAPGWVLSGLDGRAQLLTNNAQPASNVGGWGSQIVGIQSGCGDGWQVLASQARDLSETDSVQAYAIVNRKPVPVSAAVEFTGPIMELWPVADGSAAIAISRNLRTEGYEAFRLSISCGQ